MLSFIYVIIGVSLLHCYLTWIISLDSKTAQFYLRLKPSCFTYRGEGATICSYFSPKLIHCFGLQPVSSPIS